MTVKSTKFIIPNTDLISLFQTRSGINAISNNPVVIKTISKTPQKDSTAILEEGDAKDSEGCISSYAKLETVYEKCKSQAHFCLDEDTHPIEANHYNPV